MANRPNQKQSNEKRTVSGWMFGLVLAGCLVLAGVGAATGLLTADDNRRNVGLVMLGAGLVGAVGAVLVYGVIAQLRLMRDDLAETQENAGALLTERLMQLSVLVNQISEQQLISEKTKTVAYREKDRDALRRAIQEDIARGDWEAARVLVDDMEATFGYRHEADRFRQDISDAQNGDIRKQMGLAKNRIDAYCQREDWTGAHQEAQRFIAQFPQFEEAKLLPSQIDDVRQRRKKQLLDLWNEAVLAHDGDRGIQVLRLLDPYLTPAEGERMAENARSLFNDRKAKLMDAFKYAVSKQDWLEAIRVGEVAQKEFPNAKFAQEIRDTMDALKARAAGVSTEPRNATDPAETFASAE